MNDIIELARWTGRICARNALVLGAVCLALLIAAPHADAGPAEGLIADLAAAAEPVLNDRTLDRSERATQMQTILDGVIDRNVMARSLLGRYWRRADAAQQQRLSELLEIYLIAAYAGRVDSIHGDVKFAVDGERAMSGRTLVDTRVLRPSAPEVAVSWQVEDVDGRHVVTDIVVEGVSLIVSQRAEFASVIRHQGGIDGLIALLEKKLDQ